MDASLRDSIPIPKLMGIVNVTPDSFSDGGLHYGTEAAVAHAIQLWDEGAHWVDIGGESTRPGAEPVSAEEEIDRVVPVIGQLKRHHPEIRISIDTYKPQVAEAGIVAGATMVNDVRAAQEFGMAEVCRDGKADLVLMHMRGTPQSMQNNTAYNNLVEEIYDFLNARVRAVAACGMNSSRVYVDPGLGFGKSLMDNLNLITGVPRFKSLGAGVLIGASRKRFIGHLTQTDSASDRVFGSVGAALAAAQAGATVLRVHDVKATREALNVFCRVPKL